MGKIRSITFIAKLWNNNIYGNTYHAGVALVNGKPAAYAKFQYGYGEQYQESLFDELERLKIIKDREHYASGGGERPWTYCNRKGIAFYSHATYVSRKSELYVYGSWDTEKNKPKPKKGKKNK